MRVEMKLMNEVINVINDYTRKYLMLMYWGMNRKTVNGYPSWTTEQSSVIGNDYWAV